MRSGVEAVCDAGEHRLAGIALWHGGWDREPRRPLGQPQHRRVVGPPDDPLALPAAELGALVDDGQAQGDVGQPRAFRLVTGVAATPAPASRAQALGRAHVEDTGIDGLGAHPLGCALGHDIGLDRHRRLAQSQFCRYPLSRCARQRQVVLAGTASLLACRSANAGR